MKACFFGSYLRSTNGIPCNNTGDLLKAICESQGFETVECHEDCHSYGSAVVAYVRLFLRHRRISYDVMVIPWRGIVTLPLARLICKKPIVYFPTLLLHYTLVAVRRTVPRNSLRARLVRLAEKTACRWADLVVTESTHQIDYFVREYGLPREKFRQLWPAAYEPLFRPLPFKERTGQFVVLYFGTFIPTSGVRTIVRAAGQLCGEKDITFVFCGTGQDEPEIRRYAEKNRLSNVRFMGLLKSSPLLECIRNSDVCLGLFQSNSKMEGSMSNKINQALSSAKPLITLSTSATREAGLVDGENCMLVHSDSPEELARCILRLRDDDGLRRRVAMQGRRHYLDKLSIDRSGRQLGLYMSGMCGTELGGGGKPEPGMRGWPAQVTHAGSIGGPSAFRNPNCVLSVYLRLIRRLG